MGRTGKATLLKQFSAALPTLGVTYILAALFLWTARPAIPRFSTNQKTNMTGGSDNQQLVIDSATNYSGVMPRAFQRWPGNTTPLPCFQSYQFAKVMPSNRTAAAQGFLFVKPEKTGSSTAAGIHLRLARNVAHRCNMSGLCRARFRHGPAVQYHGRLSHQSFLWTVLRDPTSRIVSQFFHFVVSRQHIVPSDEYFAAYLKLCKVYCSQDYYLRLLTTESYDYKKDDPVKVANNILNEYDFVGVTERMDESAVVLSMLLQIPLGDVLYLNSKASGSYDDGKYRKTCFVIVKSFVSPRMHEYFESQAWKNRIRHDRALHQAANRSLDLTIDRLGRQEFTTRLIRFRQALREIDLACAANASVPCVAPGPPRSDTDCLWSDAGCGTPCIDRVAAKMNLFV